jgi:CheY-like chemotaxis protein
MDDVKLTWIVDDDKVTTFILRRLINMDHQFGTVVIKSSAVEALEVIKNCSDTPELLPQVIILDLNMPVMEGWEFLDEISQLSYANHIHVFLLTSSISPFDAKRATSSSRLTGFFTKPVNAMMLEKMWNLMTERNNEA